jgi:peptidoglycan hydrolase CwlO-like protein
MEDIRMLLNNIGDKLDREVTARQKTIDTQEKEMLRLHKLLEDKNAVILHLNEKMTECQQNAEGNRQLINKLLNDIERLHQDIEWYKRTYVKRSLLGTLKEKLLKR